MLVYGDHSRSLDPRRVIAELIRTIAELAVIPAGIQRHSALVSGFIAASELAQGLADSAFETLGADKRTAEQDAAMAVLMSLSRAVIDSAMRVGIEGVTAAAAPCHSGGHQDELKRVSKGLAALAALELPTRITVRRAEGYAYYALYPEAYAAAAAQIAPAPNTTVIGLRSIGTGLAAIVATALEAPAPITLRPVGPPFQRELRLSPELRLELTAGRKGRFALVDEGPGLSGSSLGCVADFLEDAGVAPERIVFFPGHDGALGAQASARHRSRWSGAARRVVGLDALISPDRLASWAQDLIGVSIAPIEDLSGGAWRCGDVADWPPSNTLQERRKFKVTTQRGPWLLKFVGLGAAGEDAYQRASSLGEAGLSPETAGLRHGFLVQRWIEGGRRVEPAVVDRGHLIARLAAYLAFRARRFPADASSGASLAELLEMTRTNAAEALGEQSVQALDVWRVELAALAPHVHPVDTDNRMHAWEWVETPNGRWLKTDAVDHAHAHDLIGPQDIAWDVVGAGVEFALSPGERETLRAAVEAACGRPVSAELVSFYRAAYLAFQLGAYTMAADAHAHWPDEQARLGVQRDRYASALQQLLASGARFGERQSGRGHGGGDSDRQP